MYSYLLTHLSRPAKLFLKLRFVLVFYTESFTVSVCVRMCVCVSVWWLSVHAHKCWCRYTQATGHVWKLEYNLRSQSLLFYLVLRQGLWAINYTSQASRPRRFWRLSDPVPPSSHRQQELQMWYSCIFREALGIKSQARLVQQVFSLTESSLQAPLRHFICPFCFVTISFKYWSL